MKALPYLVLSAAAWLPSSITAHGSTLQWGQSVTGVQLGVEVEERPFKLGERIPLSIKFTNTTATPRFPVGPIHLAGQVIVVDAKQQLIRRREDLRLEAQAKAGKVVGAVRKPPPMYSAAIKPNGILGYGLDLMKEFALDQPGTYYVNATGQVLSGLPFEQRSVTHMLNSGQVAVQIMPNPAAPPKPVTNSAPILAVTNAPPPAPPVAATVAPRVEPEPTQPSTKPLPESIPAQAPPPASRSFQFSGTLLMAGAFGVLGLLALYWMFRSDPR